jgi:hypothetical protein
MTKNTASAYFRAAASMKKGGKKFCYINPEDGNRIFLTKSISEKNEKEIILCFLF